MQAALNRRPILLFYFAAFLAALILLGNLAIALWIQDEQLQLVASDVVYPLQNMLVAAALFYAARRSLQYSKRLALAWDLLALAQFSNVLADTFWTILEVGLQQPTYPSIADGLYLAYYPLFLLGVLHLPAAPFSRSEWLKNALDLGIILLAAMLGLWNFLIGPLIEASAEKSWLVQALSLAYPMGDLILLWALLILLYHHFDGMHRGPVLLLAAGSAVMIVSDCVFSYQSLSGTYESGGLLDIGWLVAYLFSGLAGMLHVVALGSDHPLGQSSEVKIHLQRKLGTYLTYLPYVWMAGAYLLLVSSHYIAMPMDFPTLALEVGALIILVFVRQVVALRENSRLYDYLQQTLERIQQQAAELEKTNRELQQEVAERRRVEEQLTHDALHDSLTGLPNRVLFLDRLERAIAYTRRRADYPFSVLFLDFDQFKVVNDSLGHTAGDQLLVSIARRLEVCLRSSDTVARLGGDEFVILLEDTKDVNAVTQAAQRIQEELRLPFYLDGHKIFMTASIGIVLNLIGYDRPEEVLRDADIAMYRAKALGKARYEIFDASLRTRAISRLEIENDLRRALENNEFVLHYQPILSMQSERIIGFEALIRWNHPQRGLLFPQEFIPVAEESGLIISIGRWVLYEACRQMRKWQENFPQTPPLIINVNISGKQFTQQDFVDQIEQVLGTTGLNANSLRLEITETVLIDHSSLATMIFEKLHSLGVHLQIDDFGTGYSSLGYLQHFPIQTIKIDRSFITQMHQTGRNSELVKTMLLMAHDLGMDAIAEGVETEEQLNELKRLRCKYVQGYLFSRPLDAAAAARFLIQKTAEDKKRSAFKEAPAQDILN